MVSYGILFLGLFILFFTNEVCLLENGLAKTPPMGWMSWGYYMCADNCSANPDRCLNEELIMSVADAFYNEGYQEAGYEYIIIDDCWSERQRDEKGRLVPDHKRFPRGMKFLADYIHGKGLKFGMYLNIAVDTCMRYPGSRGHFRVDTKSLAEWDVDYVKVDGCFVEEEYLDIAYIKLGHYLNKTGRPMVYSCSWPYYKKYIHKHEPVYSQIVPICNMWRNYHDVAVKWGHVRYIYKFYEGMATEIGKYHGPGHWNDPDMLIVGTNALSPNQNRIQMSIWAMLSAPLIFSCDMKQVTADERRLLQNLQLIAVAQDPLGRMATPHKIQRDVTIWVKLHLPSKGDMFYSYSFAIVNLGTTSVSVTLRPRRYGLNSTDDYTVMDVFSGNMLKNMSAYASMEVIVPPEDVIMYSLFPL
ncbi:alpha-N-acetylgalactosaminidase-like [Pectinophora gossypiella]|uniref:alpha-N-acetylgalactosaminidase-like n=1 Tax=Pectinophora gossypiella TaxID=13191 RepID=UPI00214E9F86|nr:alpha-N-acetylgalactosaminidase-like [Pectinophora gossypiella]XP_049881324.1 alpha-N-acetylgalactosaminidase-like [Pectinophora gossypiella]